MNEHKGENTVTMTFDGAEEPKIQFPENTNIDFTSIPIIYLYSAATGGEHIATWYNKDYIPPHMPQPNITMTDFAVENGIATAEFEVTMTVLK